MNTKFTMVLICFLLVFVSCGGGNGNKSPNSDDNNFTPGLPSAPLNVSATAGNGQVTITWEPVSSAESYNIYWKNSPNVSKSDGKISGAVSPYVHTGLTNGTFYYYRVTAVNAAGESQLSSEVTATAIANNDWTIRRTGTSKFLNTIAWSGSQFIAGGTTSGYFDHFMLTSCDAANWTIKHFYSIDPDMDDIKWTGDQYIAVSSNTNKIFTSAEGTNWTVRYTASLPLYGIVWSGTTYVAVGGGGIVLTSPDAATWTEQSSGTTEFLYKIIWSGNKFVAVGEYGTIISSPNGISWTLHNSGTTNTLKNVAWSGSTFVAVGRDIIVTSSDGVNWSAQTTSYVENDFFYGVAWSPALSLFVTVGANGVIATSPDGATWTDRSEPSEHALGCVIWTGSQFIAVGGNGGSIIKTSSDGIHWVTRFSGNTLHSVTWAGDQFVAAGFGALSLTSTDGVIWNYHHVGTSLYGLAWSDTLDLIVGVGHYGKIMSSADGISWTERMSLDSFSVLEGVVWGGNQFVAVGYSSGSARIYTSPDGLNWTTRQTAVSSLSDIAWSGSLYVTVGGGGTIITSQDAITWVPQVSGTTNGLNAVTWTGSKFIAAGSSGITLSSTDGIQWSSHYANPYFDIKDILCTNATECYAVGHPDYVQKSNDAGITWSSMTATSMPSSLNALTYSGSRVVAVGYTGLIATLF